MREIDLRVNAEEFKKKLNIKDGDPGKTPSKEELLSLIKPLIPEPSKETIIEKTEVIKEVAREIKPEEIVHSINGLPIEPDKQIDATHIKNLPELIVKHTPRTIPLKTIGVQSITAGQNISIDNTDPYNPVISVPDSVLTDEKVKLNASDPTAGYLDDKITGYGFLTDLSSFTTTNLAEGSNLYFTTGRAITALTGQSNAIFTNGAGYITSVSGGDHNSLSNLTTGDVHTQYAILAGRATPQQFNFGTASGASAGYLSSTAHATKGKYFLNAAGTITVDELNTRLGVGIASPTGKLHVQGSSDIIQTIIQANSSQTANVLEVQNSSGSTLFAISPLGHMKFAGSTTAFGTSYVTLGNIPLANQITSSSLVTGISLEAPNIGSGGTTGIALTAISGYVGTVSNLIGMEAKVRVRTASVNATNGTAFMAESPVVAASASIGTAYGLRIKQQSITGVTTAYGVYQENSGDANYFAGKVGLGQTTPTAVLHLKAGTATANTAPLQFTSGAVETVARAGVMEFLTDDYFLTITTGAARKGIVLDNGARLTSGKIPIASTNGRLIDGPTPLAGTKVYYVSDTSGGAVTRKLTFIDGILTSET